MVEDQEVKGEEKLKEDDEHKLISPPSLDARYGRKRKGGRRRKMKN